MTVSASRKDGTDLELVDLIDEITRKLQAGEPVDIETYAAEHPDLAGELEKLLPALELLATLPAAGRRSGDSSADLTDPPAAEDASGPPSGMVGEYRVLREVGRGGMGVVYEAEQTSLGRRVALKVFPFAAALDPRRLQRFQNEARAAASLDHPNIVHVYSVGCDRGVHYYAMQYVEGRTLAEVIRQASGVRCQESGDRGQESGARGEGGMLSQRAALGEHGEAPDMPTPAPPVKACHPTDSPPHSVTDTSPLAALSTEESTRTPEFFRTVARLGIQAADALEHAHGMGVVHRDIKPSNLMVESRLPSPARARGSESPLPSPSGRGAGGEGTVTQAPHLWITDFGLAMTQTDTNLTMTGDVLGTLRYMSPEQVQAKHGVLDHRTDVYSLGVTLYELLTLQPAFPGDDRQRVIRQVAEEDPPRPRQINHAIPRDLETIVLKATTKEPDGRYATAQELADDLRRFVEDRPIRGRRPSLAERWGRWLRRRPSVVVSAALLLVVAVIAFSISTLLVTGEQRKTAAALEEKEAALSTAEANVRLAAEAVESMLTRTSEDAVFHGHVEHAEILMVDAVAMFQKLLSRSNDPMLRYRAAEAYNTVGNIQRLLGRYDESRETYRRAVALLSSQADDFRDHATYQAELADGHTGVGIALYSLSRMQEAEASFNDALAIRERLAARFPDEPKFQTALADALGNLGQVHRETDRLDQAERTCRRVLSILDRLPRECRLGPEGFSRLGAATGNLGLVLRDRGRLDEAKKLLEKAFWDNYLARNHAPDNPTYCEGLYNACWNFADLALRQGDHALAAAQVEEMVKFFPGRLQAYAEGVTLLARCTDLAAKDPSASAKVEAYNRRAGELLRRSAQAVDKPPCAANELAWFLATWPDESLRDPRRAVALAEDATKAMPQEPNHWNTLGVARYRAGNWEGAVDALKKSMDLTSGGKALDWFPLAMAYWQSGEKDETRRWYEKAVKWIEENKPDDKQLGRFRAEAAELLGTGDQPALPGDTGKPVSEEAKPEVSRQGAKARATIDVLCAFVP